MEGRHLEGVAMLTKEEVLLFRALALDHLPETRELSKKVYSELKSSRAALQAVAWAPALAINSPLSSPVERQAGILLSLVGKHPETHTEHLNDEVDGDFCGELTAILLADAHRDREITEMALVDAAKELLRKASLPLPVWFPVITAPTPSDSPSMSEKRALVLKSTSLRGAKRRIIEQWDNIEKLHGDNADGTHVWRILKRDTDAPEVKLKTVQNHLIELRKEGLIP